MTASAATPPLVKQALPALSSGKTMLQAMLLWCPPRVPEAMAGRAACELGFGV
jgi:hypothetical protein